MDKQSEIARQFELPERQSKLATMLREEGIRDEQVYCICRSTDVSRFMIGCDQCEEWYHGDCINVTALEAKKIKKFYCQKCRAKHPGLQIKFKVPKTHHHHDRPSDSKHRSEDKKHKKYSGHKSKSEKRSQRCGECEACYVKEDCGRCEPCKDKPKFGGSGKLGQKCKKRQCTNFYHLAKKHGSSHGGTRDHGRSDHTYNTASPATSSPPKSIIIAQLANIQNKEQTPPPPPVIPQPRRSRSRSPIHQIKPAKSSQVVQEPTQPPIVSEPVSNHDKKVAPKVSTDKKDHTWSSNVLRDRNEGSDQEVWEPKKRKMWHKESKSRKKKENTAAIRKRKTRRESSSDSEEMTSPPELPRNRQCFGPQCIKVARPGSKYCSDECGLKLAEARIYSVLPQRIQEWKMSVCTAEENDRKLLENIRGQQVAARKRLLTLDEKHKELDTLLERVKAIPASPEGTADDEDIDYAVVYCVTCGHEVSSRRALKHMHHCYNKLESQMTFGSMYKTKIEGNNMFCDFFNPANLTYCKRLRVMCPEHVKEPKILNNEVCGFPLTENLFHESDKICRSSKKKCIRHYSWDKLRRANIDMERVRQCLKLDELVEQERQIRTAITNRAGVLGLMLHSTYNHHIAEQMQQFHQKDKPQTDPHFREKLLKSDHKGPSQTVSHLAHPVSHSKHHTDREYHGKGKHYQADQSLSKADAPPFSSKIDDHHTEVQAKFNQKTDHHYYRHEIPTDRPKPRIIKTPVTTQRVPTGQRYILDSTGRITDTQRHHDHQYFMNQQSLDPKKHQDHLYFTHRRLK